MLKSIIDLLGKEINRVEHITSDHALLGDSWSQGFISGMKQALLLIVLFYRDTQED